VLAYREEGTGERVALLVHGYPESSYMWRHLMPVIAAGGWRAVAPDLAGFGDSPPDGPATWEAQMEHLDRLHDELGLAPAVVVAHDWGVLIAMRWACDNPAKVAGLVISSSAFHSDQRWHDMANLMRTEGEGEKLLAAFDRDGFGELMRAASPAFDEATLDEYWKGFDGEERRRGHLELYRSGEFEKLAPYDGCLAGLNVPKLVLWGAGDRFASPKLARRYAGELPDAEVVVLDGAGHFVWEDAPQAAGNAVTALLGRC
jgi:haloalkane dehalogenase